MFSFTFLMVLFVNCPRPLNSFKLCGNFCGPNYCNGNYISEELCVKQTLINSTDPIDECCKKHDECCGNTLTRTNECNKHIERCLFNRTGSGECSNLNKYEMDLVFLVLENSICGEIGPSLSP